MKFLDLINQAAGRVLQAITPAKVNVADLPPFVQHHNGQRNLERKAMRAAGGRRQWLKLVKAQRRAQAQEGRPCARTP